MALALLLAQPAPAAPAGWSQIEAALIDHASVCGTRFSTKLKASGVEIPVRLSVRKFFDQTKQVDILALSKKVKSAFGQHEGFETVAAKEKGDYRLEGILKHTKEGHALKLRIVDIQSKKAISGCLTPAVPAPKVLDWQELIAKDKNEEVTGEDKRSAWQAFLQNAEPQLEYAQKATDRWFAKVDPEAAPPEAPGGELDFAQLQIEEKGEEVDAQKMAIKWEVFGTLLSRRIQHAKKRIKSLAP